MLFRKIRNKWKNYDRILDVISGEVTQLRHSQQKLLELCTAVEKRLIHMEERLQHIEERSKIMDEDKIEDIRSRLIHIEDKNSLCTGR